MALLNKPGVLMYHIALFITFGTLFLTLKNLNIDEISQTADYSEGLKALIFGFVGATVIFGIVVTIACLISKARRKGKIPSILLILLWLDMAIMSLYTFFQGILKEELTDPGYRWVIIATGSLFFFLIVLGLLFLKFPGVVEEGIIAEKVRKKLAAYENKKDKPFCPECKTHVEKSFKYCPNCSVRFSD